MIAIASGFLGGIKRLIGVPQQGVDVGVIIGKQGDANAGRDVDGYPVKHRRLGDRTQQPGEDEITLGR